MGALQVVAQALGAVVVAAAAAAVAVVGVSSLNKGVSSCSKVVHINRHLVLPIVHPSCKVPTCHEVSPVVDLALCTYQQTTVQSKLGCLCYNC